MNEEILKRLDALAAKLGTTSTYLWSVMVKQAIVTGYVDLGVAIIFVLVGAAAGLMLGLFIRFAKSDKYKYDEWPLGCSILAGVVLLLCIGIAIGFSYSAALELANPQGWALQTILGVGR